MAKRAAKSKKKKPAAKSKKKTPAAKSKKKTPAAKSKKETAPTRLLFERPIEEADEPLFWVFVPSLVEVLRAAERRKGGPLTGAEALEARDHASCVALGPDEVALLRRSRDHDDIDPEDCWARWQAVRGQ